VPAAAALLGRFLGIARPAIASSSAVCSATTGRGACEQRVTRTSAVTGSRHGGKSHDK
jgi:hypothetical protein